MTGKDTRLALAEATAGVVGSVAAMLAFYPVDVAKTVLQAKPVSPPSFSRTALAADDCASACDCAVNEERREQLVQDCDHKQNTEARKPKAQDHECEENEEPIEDLVQKGCASQTAPSVNDPSGNIENGTIVRRSGCNMRLLLIFVMRLFRGVRYKTAHTVVSSFVYFYVHSVLVSRYKRLLVLRRDFSAGSNADSVRISVREKLFLTALAAMANTLVTLPLDVISARLQAGIDEKGKTSRLDRDAASTPPKDYGSVLLRSPSSQDLPPLAESRRPVTRHTDSIVHENYAYQRRHHRISSPSSVLSLTDDDGSGNEGGDTCSVSKSSLILPVNNEITHNHCNGGTIQSVRSVTSAGTEILSQLPLPQRRQHLRLHDLSSLWSGLAPSLILCMNPAIHFTVFDAVKSWWLTRGRERNTGESIRGRQLSMIEAFIVGLLAKFVATVCTYPLIRAKVMLMVMDCDVSQEDSHGGKDNTRNSERNVGGVALNISVASTHGAFKEDQMSTSDLVNPFQEEKPRKGRSRKCSEKMSGLFYTMCSVFRREGMRGLYRGCSLQLVHTMLKSAFLMMVRERILVATRKLIVGDAVAPDEDCGNL